MIDVSTLGDPEPVLIEGRSEPCPTKGCGTTCPICRRVPGDVHAGECAPIVVRKLEDPTHVSHADCLAVVR
jgi:hypothetical protein